jgi:Fic family protein
VDRTQFTESSPGQLRRLDLPHKDWSFLPDEMPIEWDFPDSLWPLVVEAKEALGTLDGIGQTLPNPLLLLRPLQNREAISSSSIEGTYVTPQQLLLYELDPKEPAGADDQVADSAEVANYNRALQHGCELTESLPIGNRLIRAMHKVLMQGVRGHDKTPGEFRRWQVQIGSRGRYIPPQAGDVDGLMNNFEKYANVDDRRYDPLVKSFLLHYQFEAIHPFGDGNGRVGRALLALMIYKWHGHAMPWLYMSTYFERFRDEYVENMFRISTTGAWDNWIEFCLRGAIAQATDAVRRCKLFNSLRADFHERVKKPSPRSHQLVESLFEFPVVTIPSVSRSFDIQYHTAQADVEKLVSVGILKEIADSRPRSFNAIEIFHVAFDELETA